MLNIIWGADAKQEIALFMNTHLYHQAALSLAQPGM
jgi:hypothetical protein